MVNIQNNTFNTNAHADTLLCVQCILYIRRIECMLRRVINRVQAYDTRVEKSTKHTYIHARKRINDHPPVSSIFDEKGTAAHGHSIAA